MLQCPKCKSAEIHHSRTKSKWETWRKEITGKRPFRCGICGWRGWRPDVGPRFPDEARKLAERAMAPEPPNLTNTVLAAEPRRWDEVDLHALDLPADTDVERSG